MMNRTPAFTSPVAADDLYALGHSFLSHDESKRALVAFRAMLMVAPQDERAWIGLAQAHAMLCDIGVALELFGAGMVACRSARAGLMRARLLETEGRTRELNDTLVHVSSLVDDNTDADVRAEYYALMNLH
ncbi:MAG: hypothetical protein KBF88_07945 [Polyangiaceae bacterium]|nr:hypothetical protein [Polyangiaceae bacterium]